VTTIDRIQIPPIQYFCKLAAEMVQREFPVILKSAFTS